MKRFLLFLVAAALCFGLLACGKQTPEETQPSTLPTEATEAEMVDFTGKPTLQLRVNEQHWVTVDLTPYLGKDWTLNFDVPVAYLVDGINQFALHSNAYDHGNLTDKSVDLFFTMTGLSTDSFVSSDMMNSWEPFTDRFANITVALYDGDGWTSYPGDGD